MFNINNCAARAARSKAKQDEDKLRVFSPSEVGEFVVALRAMRWPWHMSCHGICTSPFWRFFSSSAARKISAT
jgi:hypothetical protein